MKIPGWMIVVTGILFWTGVVCIIATIAGCTTTKQGQSIDRAQGIDIGSTVIGLSAVEGATEVNPLGIYLLPIKLSAGWLVERYAKDCEERAQAAAILNTVTYGAAANNIAIIAGASSGLGFGAAIAVVYAILRKRIEPATYDCSGAWQ